ncbi:MAG: DUF1592 domain-containing protein [Deltaproteobacteria bacterium]|nr:DUF1592 domain-containing protein [Deltaproteobacteria bacterium]
MMHHAGRTRRLTLSGLSLLGLTACQGLIATRPSIDPPPTTARDGGRTDASLDGSLGPPLPAFVPAAATLHRLTQIQYQNSVRQLLGATVRAPTDLELDTQLYGFANIGAAEVTVSPRAAEQFEAAGYNVAGQIFGDPAARMTLVRCAPSTIEDPCVRAFVQRFARSAWRRPLSTMELDRWVNVARTAARAYGDTQKGIEYAVAGLLQSPNFLFRVERGETDPSDPSRKRYTSYEMASRLSFLLWSSTPDEALLDAASRGELLSADSVRAQARRMLSDPRAHQALLGFFREHFKLDRIAPQTRDAMAYPLWSPALVRSMVREFEQIVDDTVLTRDGDLRDLLSTRTTFLDSNLARLYGVPGSFTDTPTRYEWPANSPRMGLLTTAAVLSNFAHAVTTSPTLRGKFVRQFLLCQTIDPPPPEVTTDLPPPLPGTVQTLRQRLEELHLQRPSCAACHERMDPIGFGLEHFDAIGAYRTTDNTLPVNARGDLDGRAFANARELSLAVRTHPAMVSCFARNVYRYATGHVEREGEEASIAGITQAVSSQGYRFSVLLTELAASDGFRYAAQ